MVFVPWNYRKVDISITFIRRVQDVVICIKSKQLGLGLLQIRSLISPFRDIVQRTKALVRLFKSYSYLTGVTTVTALVKFKRDIQ